MANGWAELGAALGGDSEAEYEKGRALGANTEEALAKARETVNTNAARERTKRGLVAAGVDDRTAQVMADSVLGGGKAADPIEAMLKNQEFGFNQKIADPNVPIDQAQRMVLTKSTNPVEQYYKVGGGYGNKFDSSKGLTPLGDAFDTGSGGTASGMQYAKALGLIDDHGHVIPGVQHTNHGDVPNSKVFYDIIHPTGRVFEAGGVPQTTDFNPFSDLAAPPGTHPVGPPAAPAARPSAPLVPTSVATSNAGQMAGAKALGEAQGKNAASLPTALNTLDTFSNDIDHLLAQPGFDSIYGARVGTDIGQNVVQFASQDAANAAGLRNKLNSESFRASISSMRGLGQLSNAEGEKVQSALTTLSNPHLSPEAARQAAAELKTRLAQLKHVAQIEAGQAPGGPAVPGATPTAGAQPGEPTATAPDGRKVVYRNGQWQPL
jgi:hypothetical protein